MENESELMQAIRKEREAEKLLAECRRRVNELAGIVPEHEQRKSGKNAFTPDSFRKACNA